MRRTGCLLLAVAYALLAFSAPAHAYDDDTHYYYCYYLARKCGFSQEAAKRIASGNVGIDYDPNVEPMQSYSPGPGAQDVRERFHAMLPLSGDPGLKEQRRRECEQRAWATRNPGQYLHFYMDLFAHDGYRSAVGHATAGHKPDFLSNDVAKAMRMTKGVISILYQFKQNVRVPYVNLIAQSGDIPWVAKDATYVQMDAVYQQALKVLRDLTRKVNQKPKFGDSPDSALAKGVVQAALGEPVPDLKDRIAYGFDPQGNVTAHADVWPLP